MGLFNFKKKNDIPLPAQPSQPINNQPTEKKEEIDFDKLLAEMPEVPPELSNDINSLMQGPKPGSQQPMQAKFGRNQALDNALPPGPLPPEQEAEPQTPLTLGGFELPDFDDEEMRRREEERLEQQKQIEARAAQAAMAAAQAKLQEAKPAEPKIVEKKPEPQPEPKPEPKPEPPVRVSYPEPAKSKPAVLDDKRFMDINTYLGTKEDFDSIRKLANRTEDVIQQHAIMSKAKNDKYQALKDSLNSIQDQLMLIDTKIFESDN
jgi:hypothetical protein